MSRNKVEEASENIFLQSTGARRLFSKSRGYVGEQLCVVGMMVVIPLQNYGVFLGFRWNFNIGGRSHHVRIVLTSDRDEGFGRI